MQKIQPALERLLNAVDKLSAEHARVSAAGEDMLGKLAALDALEVEAAHLRTEVSNLKKQNQNLESAQKRAATQVEKAMRQIDDVLGEA
jgi:chromosome segregation ATPase